MRDCTLSLKDANKTYELRIDNERKHMAEQRNALQEKYDQEVKMRRSLEERIKTLEEMLKTQEFRNRRQFAQNRGRGRGQGAQNLSLRGMGSQRPLITTLNNSDAVEGTKRIEIPQRRPSLLPRPSRPSTPTRSPPVCELGSSSTTLTSSVSSAFSRTSQNTSESFSSTDTFNGDNDFPKSSFPDSPINVRLPPRNLITPLVIPLFGRATTGPGNQQQPSRNQGRPSWANIARSGSNT